MPPDIRDVLSDHVRAPRRELDVEALWSRGRRRRRRRRLTPALLVAVAFVGAVAMWSSLPADRDIVFAPGEESPVVPAGWQEVHVAEAVFSVPAEWEVRELSSADGAPCLNHWNNGAMESRVYVAPTLYPVPCPAPPGPPDASGEVAVYAMPISGHPDNETFAQQTGEPFNSASASGIVSEHDGVRYYSFEELDTVVIVAFAPDPQLAELIANSVAPAPEQSAPDRRQPGPRIDPADLDVAWTDADGGEVPDGVGEPDPDLVINTIRGPEHCGWASAVLLHLAVPVGQAASTPEAHRQYVRDPGRVLPQERIQGDFNPVVELPGDAEPTGLRNGDIELWVAPSTLDEEVYLGRDGSFEAWPRASETIACL